jgi:hypothetical protein
LWASKELKTGYGPHLVGMLGGKACKRVMNDIKALLALSPQ